MLLSNVDRIESLLSRLKNPEEDHCIGKSFVANISAGIDCWVQSVILPEYGRYLLEVKRQSSAPPAGRPKNNQVVDAFCAISFCELDKAPFNALMEGDSAVARRLLNQGADPLFTSSLCCFSFKIERGRGQQERKALNPLLFHWL